MIRSNLRRPLIPAALALVALAACVVNLDFDYTVTGQAVQAVETSNTINAAIPINLAAQPDIQQHAGNITSLTLSSLTLTVSAVQPDNTVATITGSLSLRPSGVTDNSQDVFVGALTAYPIAVGSGVQLLGTPALDTFALATIKGSGQFQAIITGDTTGGPTADFAVDIQLSMSMGYDSSL